MGSSKNNSKQTGPLMHLFSDVKRILEFMEVKDNAEAALYETSEIRDLSELWINAQIKDDTFTNYFKYWTISMFQEVIPNARLKDIRYYMEHPYAVPLAFQENLLVKGREAFLNSYEEKNNYYRKINGLPPYRTPESEYVYLSETVRNQLHASNDPIHKLSILIQNNFMNTDEYKELVANNPDKEYLKYLGKYKIDILTARKAKDFEIIRYPTNDSGINPNMITTFAELYNKYREYVMVVLYNEQFEGIYENYRTFMKVLIKCFVLMQISNKALESVNSKEYLDDSMLHLLLSTYNIPDSLLLTNEVRRKLAINMLKLIREKGTNDIYYDLINILGYQDITVNKLMLIKGNTFNETKATGESEPYFMQVNIQDKDPYKTMTSGNATIYPYKEIISNDPTWWDLPDTRKILEESNYSVADSKYITIDADIHQIEYLFESIYFTRMILDNKNMTDTFSIEIPEIFGSKMISIYDLMVYIISATCMATGLSGKIVSETELVATAGFNFEIDLDSFMKYVNNTQCVDKDRVRSFVENINIREESDINRLYNDVMYPMREWLQLKIANASSRRELVEYENIYRALYTYDINRNSFLDDFEMPMETIRKRYNLSDNDILAYQHFYPRSIMGVAITVDQYNASYNVSRYTYPFIDRLNQIDWNFHIVLDSPTGSEDRGYLYFHDILNSKDLRTLTNPDGTRVFMDYEDGEVGWEVNWNVVNKVIELIDALDDHALDNAYFPTEVAVLNSNGKSFHIDEKLPITIRSGIYKNILKEKVVMDMNGLCEPPKTYLEYLYRKNEDLYNLLTENNRFENNREEWYEDTMRIILAVETELDLHMKYLEQSIAGSELFFKPLVTLINHFKSTYIQIAKTSIHHVFDDKMDTGGNSNMFKLFDEIKFIIHFVTLKNKGFDSQFGLFDAEHKMTYKMIMKDRSEILRMISSGFDAQVREERMGSIHIVDEVKFFKNGEEVDPSGNHSYWQSGEPGTGRWSEEDNIIMKTRKSITNISNLPVDLEGWKDFVESYYYD